MKELSLHLLDIAQNSLAAGARHVALGVEEADGELDALIGRAMANSPAPSAPGQEVSGEIRLDYPEQDAFATTLQVPAEPPAPPAAVPLWAIWRPARRSPPWRTPCWPCGSPTPMAAPHRFR